jgi:glc operon protein GlcG
MRMVLAMVLGAAAPAAAQSPALLDAEAAQAIVAGCARHAAAKGQSHGIVVADRGGATVAALRMNRASAGAMAFALRKAEAAAAWGFATSGMAEGARETPGFAFAPHIVTVAGGLPVLSSDGRVRLGAVGVSGEAPADDVACAEAGVAAAGLRTRPG